MSIHVHVTLEVKAAGLKAFCTVMAEAIEILEGQGWKLTGAYIQRTGRLNTVIDLWEIDDMNHFDRALKVFAAHPRFAQIKQVLDETVSSETIVFADKAPYAH